MFSKSNIAILARISAKSRLLAIITVLIITGSILTTLFGYFAAREALRTSIARYELPAASDVIYVRIQRDLVRPLFVSSMMANDTFLHNWVATGEKDVGEINSYLHEIQQRYGAFTAFFVSDITRNYYYGEGILKQVRSGEKRDEWFFRVSAMNEQYELNVDPDMAHNDELTVFINYRVINTSHKYLGAAGIGINISSISKVITEFKRNYAVSVYFVDAEGLLIAGSPWSVEPAEIKNIYEDSSLAEISHKALQGNYHEFQYTRNHAPVILNVRFIPELQWYLFVEKPEDEITAGPRRALWINFVIYLAILLLVLAATIFTINHFQSRLEHSALYDPLTDLLNRKAFDFTMQLILKDTEKYSQPLSILMIDIDDFKKVNDTHGHQAGDAVLIAFSEAVKKSVRRDDLVCRWGGEEFLIVLPGCPIDKAVETSEKIRRSLTADEGRVCKITASAGAATLRPDETIESLIHRADNALLVSKQTGKNRTTSAG